MISLIDPETMPTAEYLTARKAMMDHLLNQYGKDANGRPIFHDCIGCFVIAPPSNTYLEVLEEMDAYDGRTIPLGTYKVQEFEVGTSSHWLTLISVEDGRTQKACVGYSNGSMVDWRATKKVDTPKP